MKTATATGIKQQDVVQPYANSGQVDSRERKKESEQKIRHLKRKTLKALAWILVVLVCALLVLFISSKVAQFESIGDMLYFIQQHFVHADLFR